MPSQVPLQNRYEALATEDQSVDSVGFDPSTPQQLQRQERPNSRITTTSTRKKRQVIVVGPSLLRGTESPKFQADPPHREICSLPGAWVRNIARKFC